MGKTNSIATIKLVLISLFYLYSQTGISSNPDDGDNLYVFTKGATKAVAYSLDNLEKMTFDKDAMYLWMNKGKDEYVYDNISLLTFRDRIKPINSVDVLTNAEDGIRIGYNRDTQQISVECPKSLKAFLIYDLQGREVVSLRKQTNHLHFSLADQPQGIYIVKVQGFGICKNVKIAK